MLSRIIYVQLLSGLLWLKLMLIWLLPIKIGLLFCLILNSRVSFNSNKMYFSLILKVSLDLVTSFGDYFSCGCIKSFRFLLSGTSLFPYFPCSICCWLPINYMTSTYSVETQNCMLNVILLFISVDM